MSELTMCNHCQLELMKMLAERRGATVELRTDEFGWIEAKYSDRPEPSAWFKQLTDHCVC